MSHTSPVRTPIASVVKRQLPEFIREDYPTFVAFVEAYYEYLQTQGVDLSKFRDIDQTLESFIDQFKKELAYNLPIIVEDERFLLSRIKDQYLAKGSEASYKLLFKLLYGKNVELLYPGQQMLIASDGRWNQEISVFAQVDFGDPDDIVGKLVDIQTAGRILRVLIDKKESLIGEIDRIVKIGKSFEISATGVSGANTVTVTNNTGIEIGQLVTAPQNGGGIVGNTKVVSISGNVITLSNTNINTVNSSLIFSNELYEFFLDKRFFGAINPGDLIKFQDSFQARIVPATKTLTIAQPGKNFRVGQVFELRSGIGTGALMKVTAVEDDGGIKYAEFIKFGLGYTANFALSILATNDVVSAGTVNIAGTSTLSELNTYQSAGAGTISASSSSTTVTGTGSSFGSVGNVAVGDEIWTTDATPLLVGVVKSIASTTSLTLTGLSSEYAAGTAISGSYSGGYVFRNARSVGSLYAPGGTQSLTIKPNLNDRTEGFNEQGYVNLGDYVDYLYVDATYAGTIIREFSLNFRNAQTNSEDPAIISVGLGALVKYPGYFQTNNGFVSDSIFIQDSRYYQAFSYVLKIDERLSSYKSAVKTMLHPAGMALFGEFNITNNYDLSLELESLVKSLGITLSSQFAVSEVFSINQIGKVLSDTLDTPSDSTFIKTFFSAIDDTLTSPDDSSFTRSFSKLLNQTTLNNDGDAEGHSVTMQSTSTVLNTGKSLSTSYSGMLDTTITFETGKEVSDTSTISESISVTTDKYVFTVSSPDALDPQDHTGYVQLNSYYGQDYIIFADEYSVGSRESTFNTL
jgi:hypothetical protein